MWEAIFSTQLFILASMSFPSSVCSGNSTSIVGCLTAPKPHLTAEKATYQNLTAFPFLNNAEFNFILF